MVNRTICDVLKEMRTCCETNNYSYLLSLIEEAQVMANRMEARLYDVKDLEYLHVRIKELKEKKKALKKKVDKLDSENKKSKGLEDSYVRL